MVDAATGGRAVLGRAIEKIYLGVPQGSFEFLNFDSVDMARIDEENASGAITGNEGADRGTPGDIKFNDKLKYSMTPSRLLFDLVAQFGKPASSAPTGGGPLDPATLNITAGGTGHVTGEPVVVTDAGGGTGAVGTVIAAGGAITGIDWENLGSGYVTPILDLSGSGTGTATIGKTTKAWLVKIRPYRTNEVRGATLYLFEGGDYSASLQVGRRCQDITITDGANKRAEVQATYSNPTGDTISGFLIGKLQNSNVAWRADLGLKVMTRGRRPYDANFTDGKSLYLKVTAADADSVTVKTAYDVPTGETDGTNWPSPAYGTPTINIPKVTAATDGYTALKDANGFEIGLFGENFEAFEITFGASLTNLAVNDEFEIPVSMPALTKTVQAESRLSAFHLIRTLDGTTDVRIEKGTTKIDRPYKPYRASGRRIPQAIDPTGDSKTTFAFQKRLFDRFFRQKSDAHTRFVIQDVYQVESPVTGTQGTNPANAAYESVRIYAPQCAVTALKSGDIATKSTLDESVTLMAEQPDAAPAAPSGFDSSDLYPFQINIVTTVDPTWLS